jgi:branched-chain amino acid transport system permease protein
MITLTYGFGVALAGLAGVLAAPIYQVNPLMGADLIIVVFAVVVIGGLGSMRGAFVGALIVGVLRSVAISVYPELEMLLIYLIVIAVLVLRPSGLFGRTRA